MKRRAFALMFVISLAACSGGVANPEVAEDALVLMYREVIRSVCGTGGLNCGGPMRVSEYASGDPVTTTDTLPPAALQAARAEFDDVTLVDPEAAPATPYIVLGPVERPRPDVVAIKAGQICGNLCGQGTVYYFQFDGSGWESRAAEDLGFEGSIWMS